MSAPHTAPRLLTRLFLRRFLEHDFIAQQADRHELVATVGGALVAASLFAALLRSVKYLTTLVQLPGLTALDAVSDRSLYIGASMATTALAATLVWDALALEPRDALILGPLPIPRGTIVRAKLLAMLIFVAVFAGLVNVAPVVISPVTTIAKLPLGLGAVAQLTATHGLVMVLAAACAFFAVVAVRGLIDLLVPTRAVGPVSLIVQGVFLLISATSLFLLPVLTSNVPRDWFGAGSPRSTFVPPLWFEGLYETAAGRMIADAGVWNPGHFRVRARMLDANVQAQAMYHSLEPQFQRLAAIAIGTSVAFTAIALLTYLWNSRRLRLPALPRHGRTRVTRVLQLLARGIAPRRPTVRASYFFAWQSLTRSAPHRVGVAVSLALGLSTAVVGLRAVGARMAVATVSSEIAVLAVQTLVLAALVGGLRHAVRVPAELLANWAVRVAWNEQQQAYLSGVKHLGFVILVVVPVLCLLPFTALALGWPLALRHAIVGALLGGILIELSFLKYRKLPFLCGYVPSTNLKLMVPALLTASLPLALGLAFLEREAMGYGSTTWFLGALMAGYTVAALTGRRQSPSRVDFDEGESSPTLRLGLSA
jgi:hypothetical protein